MPEFSMTIQELVLYLIFVSMPSPAIPSHPCGIIQHEDHLYANNGVSISYACPSGIMTAPNSTTPHGKPVTPIYAGMEVTQRQ